MYLLLLIYYTRADCGIECNNNTLCSLGNTGLSGIYGGLIGSVWITCIGRTILFYILSLRAARILHNKMFDTVIRTPVLFFDTNPVGGCGLFNMSASVDVCLFYRENSQ